MVEQGDRETQGQAFQDLLATSTGPVPWAYSIWDRVVGGLRSKDNRIRAISAQVLCQLAASDPEERMPSVFAQLLDISRDEKFVTARHCLQALWRVGVAWPELVLAGFETRFQESAAEKNGTLVRYDILVGIRRMADVLGEAGIRERAQQWIALETDPKYRKKYAGVWR